MSAEREDVVRRGQELVSSLASLMLGWTAHHGEYHWQELHHVSGAKLSVTVDGWRRAGRVTIRGMWPKYEDGRGYTWGTGEKAPEITCGSTRPAAAIVREIRRRLLPEYLPKLLTAKDNVRLHDEHAREAAMVASRLATVLGSRLRDVPPHGSIDDVHITEVPNALCRVRVRPGYGRVDREPMYQAPVRVDFEVSGLDPETAAKVFAIIREAEDAGDSGQVRVAVATEEVDGADAEAGNDVVGLRARVGEG